MDKLVEKAQPAIDVGQQLFQKWLDVHYQLFHAFFGTQLGKHILQTIKTPRQYVYRDDIVATITFYLAFIGLCFLLTYPISFIRIVINFTPIAYPFKLKMSRYLPSHPDHGPSWCIITGPTGDLGKEFAVAFAKKGFNLLLVGRSEDKLRALVTDVEKDAKTADFIAKPHAIDLGGATEADWERFDEAVKKLPGRVTVLINNAGVSHRRVTPFEKTPPEDLTTIPAVNVVALLRITRIIVPMMIAQERGLILNIGSFSSHVPAPLLAAYAGSKAFVYTFSQALGAQLEEKGVEVRVLNTYYVTTAMSRMKRSLLIPSAKVYVKSAVATLGLPGGAPGKAYVSTPYIGHAIAQWATDRFWTEWLWMRLVLRSEERMLRKSERKREKKRQAAEDAEDQNEMDTALVETLGGPA